MPGIDTPNPILDGVNEYALKRLPLIPRARGIRDRTFGPWVPLSRGRAEIGWFDFIGHRFSRGRFH